MNIIKQIFETPDTPSGKKRLNNLITRLGLGKKVKGNLMKDVVSGDLGGDVKKYGYYRISPDIFNLVAEGREQFYGFIIEILNFFANIELNGVTNFDRISGIQGYINCPVTFIQTLFFNDSDSLPYCSREHFNLGIMVDENDTNTSIIFNNNDKLDFIYKGTLLERFEETGNADGIQFFIPITKEEYENLSVELRD